MKAHLRMRTRAFAVAAAVALSHTLMQGPTRANDAATTSIMAPVYALAKAMNRDDLAAITSLFAADGVMVDEVAPFRWVGPHAVAAWSRDDGRLIVRKNVTHSKIALGAPTFVHAGAERAYAIVPIVYTYVVGAQPQRETGLWTIVLGKARGAWHFKLLAFAKLSDTRDATWSDAREAP